MRELLEKRSSAAAEFPMSMGQQGLWHAFQRDPQSTAYNVFLPARIRSEIDLDALHQAIDWLADRHAALRTTFSADETGLQQTVHKRIAPEFRVIDVARRDDEMIRGLVHGQTQRAFDLTTGPLLRVACLQREPTDTVIVATTHHIVVDFWSLVLMMSEIRKAYGAFKAGVEPDLGPSVNNYDEFVAEQRKLFSTGAAEADWQYWKTELSQATPVLDWVTDFQRPESFTGQADTVAFSLPSEKLRAVERLAGECGATPNAVIMAALQVFIARSTRQDSFMIGTPFSGRSHQRFESTVGFFVNLLPIVADLSENPSFVELIHSVRERMLSALEHERLPFAEIVRRVSPQRDASRTPLFQVSCTFEKSHLRDEAGRAGFLMDSNQRYVDSSGLIQETFHVPHPTCHYDVEFVFELAKDEIRGLVCYCRDLFARETAKKMADNFADLVDSLLAQPAENVKSIPWSRSQTLPPAIAASHRTTLIELLRPAFESGRDQSQFARSAIQIANALKPMGVGPGSIVAVCGQRGPSTIAGILGVMLSGAAFVPVDRDQPAVSLEQLENDTEVAAVVVDEPGDWDLAVNEEKRLIHRDLNQSLVGENAGPLTAVDPNQLAYVVYTSGTTGVPKGVMVSHGAIANTAAWRSRCLPLTRNDRVLMMLSHQFDAGVGIALTCAIQGATLVWPSDLDFRNTEKLIDQIIEHRITILPLIPSLIRVLIQHPRFAQAKPLRQIWCGAEPMPTDLPRLVRELGDVQLWNFYGPTEAAVETSAYNATEAPTDCNAVGKTEHQIATGHLGESEHWDTRRVPIGTEIDQTRVHLLDDWMNFLPDTIPGQIAIEGSGLADGYLNAPEETSRVFVEQSWGTTEKRRLYLTGDIGRRRIDGELDFLHRKDDQVKVRGYRLELEEIDRTLARHPDVHSAGCKVLWPETVNAQLAAFVVPADPTSPVEDLLESVRRFASESLPSFKRPALFQAIGKIPVGTSGKVLRHQLPSSIQRDTQSAEHLQPTTSLEKYLAEAWSKTLNVTDVGVTENFFELGGSSLQAAMLTTELTGGLGVDVPTAVLFDLADIAKLSRRLVELYPKQMLERFGEESVTNARSTRFSNESNVHPLLSPLKSTGEKTPIFMIHPPGGIVACYRELAKSLSVDQPLWAIRSRGLHGDEPLPETMVAMAADYLQAIRTVQPSGPYRVGGWSLGGVIAYELAQQILESGDSVDELILLDTTIPEKSLSHSTDEKTKQVGLEYGIEMTLSQLVDLPGKDQLPFLYDHARRLGVLDDEAPQAVVDKSLHDLRELFHHHALLASEYSLQPLKAPILLVRPQDVPVEIEMAEDRGWGRWCDQVTVKRIPGHHHSMVQSPNVQSLAGLLS